MSEGDKLSEGRGHVMREDFLDMTIDGICPVKLLVWKSREIRLFSLKVSGGMLHLDKVGDDMLDLFKVPFSWSNPEPRHCHDGGGNVDPS